MNPLSLQALLSGNALFAVEIITKSLLLYLVCVGLLAAMRRSSAAARCIICVTGFACVAILPAVQFSKFRVAVPFRYDSTWQQIADAHVSASPSPATTDATFMEQSVPEVTQQPALTAHPSVRDAVKTLARPELAGTTASSRSVTPTRIQNCNGQISILMIAAAIWAAGAMLFLTRMLIGFAQIKKIRSCATTWVPYPEIAGHIPERSQVRIFSSSQPVCPMTFGWRSPTIILPADAVTWDIQRLKAAIQHEAAHINRRDWPLLTTVSLLCCVLWCHPLLWLLRSRLRIETELACDDCVVAQGMPGAEYAGHLLAIAAYCRSGRTVSNGIALALSLSISMAASKMSGKLEQRLVRVLELSGTPPRVNARRASAGVLLFVASSFSLGLLHLDALADRPAVHSQSGSIEKLPTVQPGHESSSPEPHSSIEGDPNYQSAVRDLTRMPAILTIPTTQQSAPLAKEKHAQLPSLQITNPDSSGIVWGLPSSTGLIVGIVSPPAGRIYHIGELLALEVYLKNASPSAIEVEIGQHSGGLNPDLFPVSGRLDSRMRTLDAG
jgi:BlaR1 peptidase M56